jgi:Fe-S cluster assembly scaffold protein SufB
MIIQKSLPSKLKASLDFPKQVIALFPVSWKGEKTLTLVADTPDASLDVFLFFQPRGADVFSINKRTEQKAPRTRIRVYARSLMGGSSRFSFSAICFVASHAQGSEVFFSHHALLLSPKATVRTTPALEICTDDVRAAHAASVGSFDEMVIWYLTSRGLSEKKANALVIEGFLAQDLSFLSHAPSRLSLERHLNRIPSLV